MPGSLLESSESKVEPLTQSSSGQLVEVPNQSDTSSSSTASPLSSLTNNYNNSNNYLRHQTNHLNHPHPLTSSVRSDRSDGSNYSSEGGGSASKKVSFNKAVRVKKYSSPPTRSGDWSESRFWFKVNKANNNNNGNGNSNSNGNNSNNAGDHLNNESSESGKKININNGNGGDQSNLHLPPQRHEHLPVTGQPLIGSSSSCKTVTSNSSHVNCSSQLCPKPDENGEVNCSQSNLISSDSYSIVPTNLFSPGVDIIDSSVTMPPISNRVTSGGGKDIGAGGVKIIDYSEGQSTLGRSGKSSKGSVIDDPSLTGKSVPGSKTQRVINYEPYKSASTIGLDIDSSLRPRSPSPVGKTGRHSSVDSVSRTVTSGSLVRPGSAASEEIIETKVIEKKSPLLSGVKVMFGVKAKRAPIFPTMPNRSKSVDRTNQANTTTTIRPTMGGAGTNNKTTATIVRPTFASRTTSSALKARDSPTTNTSTIRNRTPETKSSFTSSRQPLTSSLKKTTPSVNKSVPSSIRVTSNHSRLSTKSPSSLVSSEISKLMNTVTTKKPVTTTTVTTGSSVNGTGEVKSIEKSNKDSDHLDTGVGGESVGSGAIEVARERPADQSTGDLIPVSTWNSGPVLISNVANKETTSSYIPGEGKLMASFEEGTKVWKSKTRRVYEEPIKIPREKSNSPERIRERSVSPERRRDKSVSPDRYKSRSGSPDKRSSSSRNHSPNRSYQHRSESHERSSHHERSISPRPSSRSNLRHGSPERPSSSVGYRSPVRHRSPSPIIIERRTPVPISVEDDHDGNFDSEMSRKSGRTRFSPTRETFYRSSSSNGEEKKLLPSGEDLDQVFLRKNVTPNDREPRQHLSHSEDDLIVEYVPKMEDKACQCNLKKSSKSRGKGETDSLSEIGYRVIKPATDGSVSTFSNVPDISDAEETETDHQFERSARPRSRDISPIVERRSPQNDPQSEVIYSQIDRTKKRAPNQPSPVPTANDDLDHYHHRLNQPGEFGPDDYLYESNAIRSARSSVSPSQSGGHEDVSRRAKENSTYRRQSPSPSPSRRYMFEMERKGHKPESPSPSPSASPSPRPKKTVSVTHKTYGMNMRTALDAPEVHVPVRPPSTKPVRVIEKPYHQHHPHDDIMSRSTGGRLENHSQGKMRSMREETLSNHSNDEFVQSGHMRRGSISDPEDLIPKSVIREIDHRKGEINYENVTPRHRSSTAIRNSLYEDGHSAGNGMWFRSLDADYRKGMSDRESYNNHHHESPNHNVTDYCTMSRRGRDRLTSSRDVGADYQPPTPSTMTHAYTLDRRHLDRAKRSNRPGQSYPVGGSHLGISSPTMSMSMNGGGGVSGGSRVGSPSINTNSMRKYNSTRDLSHLSPSNDFSDIGSTRGGLAAAYKARQRRASSLSRYGQSPNHGYHIPTSSPSPHHYPRTSHSVISTPNYPLHSGSHSQLHRVHLAGSEIGYPHYPSHHHHHPHHHPIRSSASHIGASYGHSSSESEVGLGPHHRSISGSRSRLAHHQNDPVVLYIPAISHHNRPVDEDDRNSALGIARTQSILSSSKRSIKSGLSTSSKKREPSKERDDNFNEITSKVNDYLNNNNNNNNGSKNKNNKKNEVTSTIGLEGDDEIIELRDEEDTNNNKTMDKKKDVKRSVSIPKDTKLPWLQKLKMKVKS